MPRNRSLQGCLAAAFGVLLLTFAHETAHAATLRVPSQYETLQLAVDAAAPGDTIQVTAGSYCGAVIDKPLELIGSGSPRVVGCTDGPVRFGRNVGIVLSPQRASSGGPGATRIEGFVFGGAEDAEAAPLSLGIFSRFVHDVQVSRNGFVGLLQPITNTAGDRWLVFQNQIDGLLPVDCLNGCLGGVGIAILATTDDTTAGPNADGRPEGNRVVGNRITGSGPGAYTRIGTVGVLLAGAWLTRVASNRVDLSANATSAAPSQGILVTDFCCGAPGPVSPVTRRAVLTLNDVSATDIGIRIEGADEGGRGHFLFNNVGKVVVNGMDHRALTTEPLLEQFAAPRPFR